MSTLGPAAKIVEFAGGWDEIDGDYQARGWTDGLPIVPPTEARVREFLRHTKRDPREIVGDQAEVDRAVRAVATSAPGNIIRLIHSRFLPDRGAGAERRSANGKVSALSRQWRVATSSRTAL